MQLEDLTRLRNPFSLKRLLWPQVTFYKQQAEFIESIWSNYETVVPAGNMLGKDFGLGFVVIAFALTRYPCRIVCTSAKSDHLSVLRGEVGWFLQNSRLPLTSERGGPFVVNKREIKRMWRGAECPLSYIKFMVASMEAIAAMQGHHIKNVGDGVPRTLFVIDEASSVPDDYHEKGKTWANRIAVIGNTWPCENFFKRAVDGGGKDRGGDIRGEDGKFYRRVIRIQAEDSPNVRYALAEIAAGRKPSGRIIVPGVKDYATYVRELATFDPHQLSVSHKARFYSGGELLLFTSEMLNAANDRARALSNITRKATAIGVDSGQGVANTTWTAADALGVIEQLSVKTADTDVIPGMTIAFAQKHRVPAEKWLFDPGGGGKQHVDRLRASGFRCRLIAFGSPPTLNPGHHTLKMRRDTHELRISYASRRAQMFGEMADAVRRGWAIPAECDELMRQLSKIPKHFDDKGRLKLLPKNAPDGQDCLVKRLGASPDEADSAALALHGVLHKSFGTARAGAL